MINNWMRELKGRHNDIIKKITLFKGRLNCKNQQEEALYNDMK